jgi:hypothetical protein
MAILRAMDGKFYDVPDEQAKKFEVPREKVKDVLAKAGTPPGGGGRPGPRGGPPGSQVVIQVFPGAGGQPAHTSSHGQEPGEVDPYYWWWNNWSNY